MGDGIQRVKVIICGDKGQVAKLYGNGVRKHQGAVPENKDPEKVGQQPKTKMI